MLRELYPQNGLFKISYINKDNSIPVIKEYPRLINQSKSVFASAISSSGFAIVIDTYFSKDPHIVLDFYLYDNSGIELFHIYYQNKGCRKFKFSDSGKYFILLDFTHVYVYDMYKKQINIFSPEDIGKSDYTDFTIFEEKKCIAYCYTHHPDKPFYHFTFSGQLLEENAFHEQVNKMDEIDEETKNYYALLDQISNADRPLSENDYNQFMQRLQSYSTNPDFSDSAWLYRRMGELELEMSNKEKAFEYFTQALSLDPAIGVKRIAAKLSKELNKS